MRSIIAFFVAFAITAIAIAIPAFSGKGGQGSSAASAAPACTLKLNRKYDYNGRLYIQKVRICRRDGGSA